MLQQTQVKTVIPYWERWMRELPSIQSLADARPEKIHKLWEGLGYYTRVRNMQKAAQQIVSQHDGKFPREFDDILALPGIGRYTAGAISSIAFNEPQPILDGNVIRVLTRVFSIAENPREKSTNEKLWRLATDLVSAAAHADKRQESHSPPSPLNGERDGVRGERKLSQKTNDCSHLNQSLMELGALICAPKQPQCLLCPVRPECIAHRTGRVEQLPNLGPRVAATSRRFVAFAIENRGRFLVRQRPAGVVNAHLWEFPNVETVAVNSALQKIAATELGLKISSLEKVSTIRHTITRYRITLDVYRVKFPSPLYGDHVARSARLLSGNQLVAGLGSHWVRVRGEKPQQQSSPLKRLRWLTLSQLDALAFTSAHRKILKLLGA